MSLVEADRFADQLMRITTPRHAYGWRKDRPDPRDFKFAASPQVLATLPDSVDLRPNMPPIVDQGQLGSCTGNAWAVAFDCARKRQGLQFVSPSRLFIYYGERVIEGSVNSDSGAEIRDGIKTLAQQGVCPEPEWPYNISLFAQKPPQNAYADALRDVAVTYYSVQQTTQELMGALAGGYPVVFGFLVYQQFENMGPDGIVKIPARSAQPLGGHANCLVGYHHDAQGALWFDSQNSWGPDFGDHGFVRFPAAYLTNSQLASDFWALEVIRDDTQPPPPQPSTFAVGPAVLAAMQAHGVTPTSHELYLNHGADKTGWVSLTSASDGTVYRYVQSQDRVYIEPSTRA